MEKAVVEPIHVPTIDLFGHMKSKYCGLSIRENFPLICDERSSAAHYDNFMEIPLDSVPTRGWLCTNCIWIPTCSLDVLK